MSDEERTELIKDRRIQILAAVVLLSLLLAYVSGLKFGIEFEGGTRIPITLEKPVDGQTMSEIVNTIKTRVGKFGLTQVVVKGVGESQVYVEVPRSDSELVGEIERIVKKEGRYEGIVDGKLAVDGREIIPGSIRQEGTTVAGNRVTWSVGFAITRESAEKFGDVVFGKGGYPVYMFLDRPENAFVLVKRERMLANTSLSELDSLELLNGALRKEENVIHVFILEDWENSKADLWKYNFTNETRAIVANDIPQTIVNELESMNITVLKKTPEEMTPTYSLTGDKRFVERWAAVGMLSAPVLSEDITKGSAGQLYTINGPAAGVTLEEQLINADSEMKELKSILSGGALPVRVILGSSSTIPAPLGAEFLRYSIVGLVAALLAIVILVSFRYRRPKLILPILVISVAEITIIVCIMGSVGTIDLSAMAGIIAAMGTSVDAQIIVTDELTRKDTRESTKRRLEKAFSIIVTNASIAIIAIIPLLFSGLLEIIGFATTLAMGYTLGVFITRPAYGVLASRLVEND